MPNEIRIAQVADYKVIGVGFTKAWESQIGTADPEALALEPSHQMVTDEATGAAHQRYLTRWHFSNLPECDVSYVLAVSQFDPTSARYSARYRTSGESNSPEQALTTARAISRRSF
jgi:hypothetical protein